ncbi:hypothetical protein [Dickeya solani]|uniref:Uncharacterized protein n=1 Tax=Dickeya solani TaxID=1089444 RepID=A0ABU4EFI8_9GAMM|nr:hypothetical protein [Dickeya solani]MCA7001314.1 hypothetical protein [Dickeya solani]MCZ0821043.1 hypothetical protein [Dickeya solani]MDV6996689.1 hypothetical protein [Dickeya solani]MDV7002839.1 hypothetical protein [Dickeya solani]MDV7038511.1 hypothetical protein [Dickeya solani]
MIKPPFNGGFFISATNDGDEMAMNFFNKSMQEQPLMKKFLLSVLITATFNAAADPVPQKIEELIKVYQTKSYSLESGKLTIVIKKPQITEEMIRLFFHRVCYGQFDKKPWPPEAIISVVMLNANENQGYTVKGGGKECKKLGPMPGDEADAYIKSLIYAN